MDYSIKEISERLRIPASTLRYYEKRGLIGPLRRGAGQVGMPIEEIREFVGLIRQGDATLEQRTALFERHQAQIEHQIEALQENLAVLKRKMRLFNTPKK